MEHKDKAPKSCCEISILNNQYIVISRSHQHLDRSKAALKMVGDRGSYS